MSTTIFLAKYVPDVRRGEPINIGVIVAMADKARGRFRGLLPDGTLDRRRIPFAQSADVYREWIRFWQRAIDDGPTGLQRAVDRSQSSFLLVPAGEIVVGSAASDIDDLTDRYYQELVLPEKIRDKSRPLEVLSNRVLQRAGIRKLSTFTTDVHVAASGLPALEDFRFHYGWSNGHQAVAHRVTLYDRDVVDAVQFRFEHLPEDYLRIALIRGQDNVGAQANLIANLEDRAHLVVDVEQANAPRRLQALVTHALAEDLRLESRALHDAVESDIPLLMPPDS